MQVTSSDKALQSWDEVWSPGIGRINNLLGYNFPSIRQNLIVESRRTHGGIKIHCSRLRVHRKAGVVVQESFEYMRRKLVRTYSTNNPFEIAIARKWGSDMP